MAHLLTKFKLYSLYKQKGIPGLEALDPVTFRLYREERLPLNTKHWTTIGALVVEHGETQLFEYLAMKIGGDAINSKGHTQLHVAAYCRYKSRLQYLIENQVVDINALDRYGRTCLFYLKNFNESHFEFMVEHGANLDIVDHKGLCAGEYKTLKKMRFECYGTFDKYNARPLLNMALRTNDPYLARDTVQYVANVAPYPHINMLIASGCIYYKRVEPYLIDLLPYDGEKLFRIFDQFFIDTFGFFSEERHTFLITGFNDLMVDKFNVELYCFEKYHELILERGDIPICQLSKLQYLYHQVKDRMYYARRYMDLPIVSFTHWYILICWLYAAREDSQEYYSLLKKAVVLRDVFNQNTLLHILATDRHILPSSDWINLCLEMGADVDALNAERQTPLHLALLVKKIDHIPIEFCQLLLQRVLHYDITDICGYDMMRQIKRLLSKCNDDNLDKCQWLESILKHVYPLPLQCLAAKMCHSSNYRRYKLPDKIRYFIKLHSCANND